MKERVERQGRTPSVLSENVHRISIGTTRLPPFHDTHPTSSAGTGLCHGVTLSVLLTGNLLLILKLVAHPDILKS